MLANATRIERVASSSACIDGYAISLINLQRTLNVLVIHLLFVSAHDITSREDGRSDVVLKAGTDLSS